MLGPWSEPDPRGAAGSGSTTRQGCEACHPLWLCPQMGYHCWLCGKNSNSKKQWQQHIQSEKHKEKVFTSDSDASGWAYRFPMGEFRLCDRCFRGGRPAGVAGRGLRGWRRGSPEGVVAGAGSGPLGLEVVHGGWGVQKQLLLEVSTGRAAATDPSFAALGQMLGKAGQD